MTSPCLHRSYSCGTVSPACKVRSGQLHVYIAVRYAMPSGSARRERDSAASQRRHHEGGSSQGVSGRRRDSAASQRRRHEGGASQGVSGTRNCQKGAEREIRRLLNRCQKPPGATSKTPLKGACFAPPHVHILYTLWPYHHITPPDAYVCKEL